MRTLNIEQHPDLLAYLRRTSRIEAGEQPECVNLAGGVSNRTVLVKRVGGEQWVLKQALAKLRVPVDWFSSPERVHREALGLRWLGRLAPARTIPALIFEDFEHHLMAMQAVPQPHANWKTLLLEGQLKAEHITQFAQLLGTVHRAAYERRAELEPVFADRSFFESLRLEPYYSYTATWVPEAAPFIQALIAETRSQSLTLVHGDYSPKNILVYRGKLILLDHEVIHFGDPAFDMGFSMTHLLSKAHHLSKLRPDFAAAARQYWQVYLETLGSILWLSDFEPRATRHTLACLLARVAGRSPLEYLPQPARQHQREVVAALMLNPPATMPDLITQFVERL